LELTLELCLKDLDLIFELGIFNSLVQVPLIGLAQLPIELVVALDEFADLLLLLKARRLRLLEVLALRLRPVPRLGGRRRTLGCGGGTVKGQVQGMRVLADLREERVHLTVHVLRVLALDQELPCEVLKDVV
jgi:hypothetical protein